MSLSTVVIHTQTNARARSNRVFVCGNREIVNRLVRVFHKEMRRQSQSTYNLSTFFLDVLLIAPPNEDA